MHGREMRLLNSWFVFACTDFLGDGFVMFVIAIETLKGSTNKRY